MRFLILLICFALSVSPTYSYDKFEPAFLNSWKECFRFMAGYISVEDTDDSLFKLAAESSMDWYWLNPDEKSIVMVIKLETLKDHYSAIRGVQGNGLYYLFKPVKNGFHYLGRMDGNSYRWGTLNGKPRFTTQWHMSANESIETIYDWNGTSFSVTKSATVTYKTDGTRVQ
jgi:hypothetical protein